MTRPMTPSQALGRLLPRALPRCPHPRPKRPHSPAPGPPPKRARARGGSLPARVPGALVPWVLVPNRETECLAEKEGVPIPRAKDKFILAMEAAPKNHPSWADPNPGAVFSTQGRHARGLLSRQSRARDAPVRKTIRKTRRTRDASRDFLHLQDMRDVSERASGAAFAATLEADSAVRLKSRAEIEKEQRNAKGGSMARSRPPKEGGGGH